MEHGANAHRHDELFSQIFVDLACFPLHVCSSLQRNASLKSFYRSFGPPLSGTCRRFIATYSVYTLATEESLSADQKGKLY
mmetsp:Transcript_8192/g.24650  ORF Transcript_8192/g.24650 Transcript_8192/m.24650 type:complete len:81 (+) Transcript_8192:24-266(+)